MQRILYVKGLSPGEFFIFKATLVQELGLGLRPMYSETMDEKTLKLFIDLHMHNKRQGPGSDSMLQRALDLSGIDRDAPLSIADIGCGTGISSLALAKNTQSHITAVDLSVDFLEKLKRDAAEAKLLDRITTLKADIAQLPFQQEQFDVIWAQGAIYSIGFTNGIKLLKKFLKPRGVIVLTEITWLTHDVPKELREYWQQEYPEIAHASAKIRQLEENGYVVIGYFPLSEYAWLDNYYNPLQASFNDFLERNGSSKIAKEIVEAEKGEIELYKKFKQQISYGCYIAQKSILILS